MRLWQSVALVLGLTIATALFAAANANTDANANGSGVSASAVAEHQQPVTATDTDGSAGGDDTTDVSGGGDVSERDLIEPDRLLVRAVRCDPLPALLLRVLSRADCTLRRVLTCV